MPLTPLSLNLGVATAFSCFCAGYGHKAGMTKSKAANFAIALVPSVFLAFKLTSFIESRNNSRGDTASLVQRNMTNLLDIPDGGHEFVPIINCVALFDDPSGPSNEFLVRAVSKLLYYDRMNSVLHPASPIWSSQWEQYPNPDIPDFISDESCPPGLTLQQRIEQISNTDLDLSKPAWKIYIIRNGPNNQSAILFRVAHWIGDGLRLADIIADAVLTDADGHSLTTPEIKSSGANRPPPREFNTSGRVDATVGMPFMYKHTFPREYRMVVNENPVSLERVRLIKNQLQCTVNDVLMSALCGAIRRYIELKSNSFFEKNSNVQYSAVIVVGIRGDDFFARQKDWLRNDVGGVLLPLPFHLSDFKERCEWIRSHVLKGIGKAGAGGVLMTLLARLGLDNVIKAMTNGFGGKVCATTSNIPGWQFPCYMDGLKIRRIYAVAGAQKPIFLFMSYNGEISLSCIVDPANVAQPEKILDYFEEEIEVAYGAC